MKILEQRSNSPGKWFLAGLVLTIALTFTLADVNAFNYPYNATGGSGDSHPGQANGNQMATVRPSESSQETDPASAVPEPTTMLLMAGGLGVMAWKRRRSRAQE